MIPTETIAKKIRTNKDTGFQFLKLPKEMSLALENALANMTLIEVQEACKYGGKPLNTNIMHRKKYMR